MVARKKRRASTPRSRRPTVRLHPNGRRLEARQAKAQPHPAILVRDARCVKNGHDWMQIQRSEDMCMRCGRTRPAARLISLDEVRSHPRSPAGAAAQAHPYDEDEWSADE